MKVMNTVSKTVAVGMLAFWGTASDASADAGPATRPCPAGQAGVILQWPNGRVDNYCIPVGVSVVNINNNTSVNNNTNTATSSSDSSANASASSSASATASGGAANPGGSGIPVDSGTGNPGSIPAF